MRGILLASVRHLVQARSGREPLLIFVDDAHWIDSGSDEFLAQMVEAAGGTRTLVLVNFRPEYHAEWTAKSYYRQVPLSPLGPTVQAVLAARIDRLAERERRVLQTAALIGKEFTRSILERVADLTPNDLSGALGELERAEFIFERSLPSVTVSGTSRRSNE